MSRHNPLRSEGLKYITKLKWVWLITLWATNNEPDPISNGPCGLIGQLDSYFNVILLILYKKMQWTKALEHTYRQIINLVKRCLIYSSNQHSYIYEYDNNIYVKVEIKCILSPILIKVFLHLSIIYLITSF